MKQKINEKVIDNISTTSSSNNKVISSQQIYKENEINASIHSSVVSSIDSTETDVLKPKKISIRPKLRITKTVTTSSDLENDENQSNLSTHSTVKPSIPSVSSDVNNINSFVEKRKSVSKPMPPITLDGVTLQKMIESLVEEYGWDFLYEETKLRCFKTNPTVPSSLKVLRQDGSIWARKKIEYLYLEMRKKFKNKI